MRSFAFVLALVAAASAIPSPDVLTNGQRLARNLPPLPPRFVNIFPGRRSPTPVAPARRSSPSAFPVTHTGHIEVRKGDASLGFVQNNGGDGLLCNVGTTDDLQVSVTTSGSGPFDVLAIDPKWTGDKYLGAASLKYEPVILKKGTHDVLAFTSVPQTPLNSPPVNIGGKVFGESRVWELNNQGELTVSYVNPDGSRVHALVVYDAQDKTCSFASDASGGKEVVKLYLVS